MVERKERPVLRKDILNLLQQKKCTLEDLLKEPHKLSDGIKKQVRKMIKETKMK